MATSRVRHRGQPPRDIDHGPASGAGHGSAIGAHAEVARLSAYAPSKLVPVGERLEGGAGAIERRQATEAQREAWRAEPKGPSPIARVEPPMHVNRPARPARPAMGSKEHLQQSRMRGAARHVEVITGRSPVNPVTPEELVMEPIAALEPMTATLAIHIDAARAAQDAWEAFDAADTARIHAEEAWLAARAALEASWLALWEQRAWMPPPDHLPAQELELADGTRMRVHSDGQPETLEAIRELGEVAVAKIRSDAAADAAAAGGGLGARSKLASGLTRRQEEVLAVVRRHRGDRAKAAAELKVRYQSVNTVLEAIGKAGKLPTELIAQLPASFARFTGV